jgi:hypothetical protein
MVLGIDQTHFGLLLSSPSVVILYLFVIRSGTSFVLSYSFPDAKSTAIGKDCGVTATCI